MSDTLASLVVKIGADISGYTKGVQDATAQLGTLTHTIESMGEKLGELALEFVAFESLKEFATEAIEAAAGIEKATISLTALSGSAKIASETIEKMEALAKDEALSFPELLAAAQHMTAIGLSLEEIEPALAAAGNAAWALNSSVGEVSAKMEGMALSGMAGSRQLKGLGLSSEDLAKVLGVTADQAKETFKALDESSRLSALTLAMAKFGDVAIKQGDGITGSWVRVKNAWHETFAEIGSDLLPIASFIEKVAIQAANVAAVMVAVKNAAGGGAKEIGEALAAVGKMTGGVKPPGDAPGIPADAEPGYLGAAKAARELAEAVKAIHDDDGLTAYGRSLEALKAVQEAYKYGYASAQDLKDAQNAVTKAYSDAEPTLTKWVGSMAQGQQFSQGLALRLAEVARINLANFDHFISEFQKGNIEAPELSEHLTKLVGDTKGLNDAAVEGAKAVNYLADAYKTLGLTFDSVSGAVSSKLIEAFNTIAADSTTTAEGIETVWGRASGAIDRLAKTNLPEAIAEYDKYIAALQRTGAPLADIYAAQTRQLQLEIKIDNERGTSATKEIIQLTNLQRMTQMLADKSNQLGNVYSGLMKNFDGAFTTLSHGIAGAISGAQSFGQAWKGIITSIETSILDTIIGGAFGALKVAIEQLIVKMFGIKLTQDAIAVATRATSTALDVAQVMGYAAVAAAAAFASTAAIPLIGPFLAPEAAALAYSEVSALAPLAAFDTGGWVPNDMVAQIHKGEYVVPAHAAAQMSDGPMGGGGGNTVNVYFPNVKTVKDSAVELANLLKGKSPKFSPFST